MERTIDLTLETNSLESIIEKTLTSQMEKKNTKNIRNEKNMNAGD